MLAPESKLDKLGHALVAFGSTTPGAMIYAALGALAVAVLRWALSVVPKGAASGLVLVLALSAARSGAARGSQPAEREALAVETQRCLANERAIVDRPDTTEGQDRADLASERSRCDVTSRRHRGRW